MRSHFSVPFFGFAEIVGEPFAGRMHDAKGDLRTWVVLLCGCIVKSDGFEDICLYAQAFLIKKPEATLRPRVSFACGFLLPAMRLFDIRFHSQGMLEQIA
jgi:hypothetical protein